LNRESSRIGFTMMILQKNSYPLGATCFTEKECNSIQAKYMPTVLSKWESTDQHQLKYTLDRHSTQACP
jgi:hypothetical protein